MIKFEPYQCFYRFDWTSPLRENIDYLLPYRHVPTSVLEIGVFEARSAVWWLENILTHPESRYVGIDDWKRLAFNLAYEHENPLHFLFGLGWCEEAYQIARSNLDKTVSPEKWKIIRKESKDALLELHQDRGPLYDIVYIDGDHEFSGCLTDTMLAWQLTKDILIWDDYYFPEFKVKHVVDYFLKIISGEYDILFQDKQLGIRKRPGLTSRLDFVVA